MQWGCSTPATALAVAGRMQQGMQHVAGSSAVVLACAAGSLCGLAVSQAAHLPAPCCMVRAVDEHKRSTGGILRAQEGLAGGWQHTLMPAQGRSSQSAASVRAAR